MNRVVVGKTYRFTVITDYLLRIEEDDTGKFEDRPTQTVLNRDFDEPEVGVLRNSNGHEVEIDTKGFHLYYDGGNFSAESLYIDIKKAYSVYQNRWYFGEDNDDHQQNLLGTVRTLDHANGAIPLDKGIMSRDGYSYLDDSKSFIYQQESDSFKARDNLVTDGYLFCYGRNYQKTLTDFYQLTGPTPLLPRFALGNWWSRYYQYTQAGYQSLMRKFDKKKVPINVSVLDMDWHKVDIPQKFGSGWTGYSWNTELFPEHQKLLQWLHDDGKKVTVNVHPAAGIRAFEDVYPAVAKDLELNVEKNEPATFELDNKKFRQAYFNDVHHKLEDEGIDFWWLDWQQGLAKNAKKMDPLWLLNYYHFTDNDRRTNGNGLILSRYAGPGSHRYPLGFSGDSVISWKSLDFQPYFTATAANIGYTWWSHDIGGHMHGDFDGELATRWLQFGVFSPINRLHSSNNTFSGKEPWNYRSDFENTQEEFMRLRTKLVPYIDTANYKTHTEGIPLVKPLYYDYPEKAEAYAMKNEYFFGSEMLISPITSPHDDKTQMAYSKTWLPSGDWVDYFSHLRYRGDTVIKTYRDSNTIPVFVRLGSLIVTNPDYMNDLENLPTNIQVEVFAGRDGSYEMVEHLGDKIAKTLFTWNELEESLKWIVNDPDNIIPKYRQISLKTHHDNRRAVDKEFNNRLQRAYISFDLKQQLSDAFNDEKYKYASFMNLINTLENNDLRSSLSEVAYIRHSYNS
ncbi:TIM-barrel domain-containing protein [Companilactobacillus huachuanensis]|uniref:TIM-barrel domain-containing protein n=1 Tax=Companilactobacillus huachuanensis TaxID=2559914 RepID=A0ABW1RP76_9LACO|nr:TIM-barrel domain-containing protein [Companilactobacillus huachuanensis]